MRPGVRPDLTYRNLLLKGPDVDDSRPTTTTTAPVIVGIGAIGPCVIWTGYLNAKGYGTRWVGGRTVLAHRHAWTEAYGDPGAWHVCHRCDVPACINVAHLFLGTNADNNADKVAKGRQARQPCNQGERHGSAKLTEDVVREIRASPETNAAIARRLGIAPSNVSNIRLRKGWAHIPDVEGSQPRLTDVKGERNGSAKLTADQVREIRASTETNTVIAHRFGVSQVNVSMIRLRKRWAHVL